MTGGNTPCKMCQLPKVGRWCLHTVRLPSAVCRLPLRTAPQRHRQNTDPRVLLFLFWFLACVLSFCSGSSLPCLARHPSSSRHPSERAKLNLLLHLRDLSEKNEGFHVLCHAMAASSAMGRFRRRFWAGQRTPGPQRSPRWLRICCNHFGC